MTAATMPTEWIKVDDSKYESDETKHVRNVLVHLSRSPYDVPKQVRGRYNDKLKAFIVELKYLDDEPTREVRLDDHSFAHLGKHSNRIYSIELGAPETGAGKAVDAKSDEWLGELEKAFDELRIISHVRERSTNYSLTRKVISDHWRLLAGWIPAKP